MSGQQSSLDTLDEYIVKKMHWYGAPGLSISIVHKGEVIYNKGFGTRIIDHDSLVDANTLFAIGSISKSFTPLALALLVDEGKIHWDDPVKKYLPEFTLYDTCVSTAITIRDLLTHRSGLKSISGGTLGYHSVLTRDEIISRIKYLKPASPFRTTPAYQNIMFIVAAKVVETVTNQTWDDYLHEKILLPLGMRQTVTLQAERLKSANIASPHIKDENLKVIPIEQEKLDNISPAMGIYSSADEMATYMKFMLNNGLVGENTLIKKESFNEILTPQFLFPFPTHDQLVHNEFTSYGFGWWLTPFNGYKIVEHAGGVDGMVSNLVMVKNREFGVVVMTNSSDAGMIAFDLTYNITGNFLNEVNFNMLGDLFSKGIDKKDSLALVKRAEIEQSRIPDMKPTLREKKYTGTYVDDMYGLVSITREKGRLKISFSNTPLFTGYLEHWHYDTFAIDWIDPRVKDGFLTFIISPDGEITGIELNQPNLLDVDFSELNIRAR